jgi:ankyrin repeat domain-containing protein 50
MAEALGVAGSVVGIVSFGIQLCQGLVQYYGSWKDRDDNIKATTSSLENLSTILVLIQTSVQGRSFPKDIVETVEKSIESCESGIKQLNNKLAKVKSTDKADLKSKLKDHGGRLLYPFKESTLAKLREVVADIRANLSLSLAALRV